MSDELKQFYREIWAWVQAGCPENKVFRKGIALCFSLYQWNRANNPDLYMELDSEQQELFEKEGLNGDYPFNIGNPDWEGEVDNAALYKNPKRLAFIEEHAK